MHALLQILKVNELKKGKSAKTGKDYEIQDCECVLLDESGNPDRIGVLLLPKNMMGDHAPKPGTYTGAFTLSPDVQTRQIMARLVGLTPVPPLSRPAK